VQPESSMRNLVLPFVLSLVAVAPACDDDGDELDPDEPRTPLWLPLLGLVVFAVGLTWLLARSEAPDAAVDEAAPAPSGSAAP